MKFFQTALFIIFAVFGVAVGSVYESIKFLEDGLAISKEEAYFQGLPKDIFFSDRNYLLPVEKIREPLIVKSSEEINIASRIALAIDEESGKVLYKKDSDKKTAFASITKLMTAIAVLEFASGENEKKYDLSRGVVIDKSALDQEGDSAKLIMGEKIKASDLMTAMLVASSNDAAYALAEDTADFYGFSGGVDGFVREMNNIAAREKLANTHFLNPSGVDQDGHYSTAEDVVKIVKIFFRRYPEFFKLTKINKINIRSEDGKNDHLLINTNKLLEQGIEIEGGKTGYTEDAGESLAIVAKNPTGKYKIITVVIGADDRFAETEKLVNWIWKSYEWK